MADLVLGSDPADRLAEREQREQRRLSSAMTEWLDSRIDVTDATLRVYRQAVNQFTDIAGDQPLEALTVAAIQQIVNELAERVSGRTINTYLVALKMALDYASVSPNPARDRAVRVPRHERPEIRVPSRRHVEEILGRLPVRHQLPYRLLAATGMRSSEAQQLRWGDMDASEGRLLIARGKTKASRRWISVPGEVLDDVLALVAPEDRAAERKVFPVQAGGHPQLPTALAEAPVDQCAAPPWCSYRRCREGRRARSPVRHVGHVQPRDRRR